MRLSKRGEYGMRAMIFLAVNGGSGKLFTIRDIAEQENIPTRFLEQILLTLKNAGMLHSKMGPEGGYYLARPSEEITLGSIERILDGPLAPIGCVSQTAYEPCTCPDEDACGLRMAMLDVRNEIARLLDRQTLAEIAGRVRQRKGDL